MVLYECKICLYSTKILTHYNKHLKTKKHLRNTNQLPPKVEGKNNDDSNKLTSLKKPQKVIVEKDAKIKFLKKPQKITSKTREIIDFQAKSMGFH